MTQEQTKEQQRKLYSEHGLARIHVLLMVLCGAVFVLIMVPVYKSYRYHGEWLACADSLRVVNGALIVELITNGEAESLGQAEQDLVSVLPGRDGYCPSGGTIYFRKGTDGEWKAVCGKHDSDHLERARLNASYVLKNVREEVRNAQLRGTQFPDRVTVELNGEKLVCERVSEETGLRRGTGTTKGYENKGTVVYYGLEGYGSFRGTGVSEGEVGYFCFADEENCANWRADDGWTGSAYSDRY